MSFSRLNPHARLLVLLNIVFALAGCGGGGGGGQANNPASLPVVVGQEIAAQDAQAYFPLHEGHGWTYQGRVSQDGTGETEYFNHVRIVGTENVQGGTALIVTETNPDNSGQASADYVRKVADGVWELGPADEDDAIAAAITPYRAVTFPLRVGVVERQVDKVGIDSGEDIDSDGRNEKVDIVAEVIVTGFENIIVPGGSFLDCLVIQETATFSSRLSRKGEIITASIRYTRWLAKGVGAVKREMVTEASGEGARSKKFVTEELTSTYNILATESSLSNTLYNPVVAHADDETYVAWSLLDNHFTNRFVKTINSSSPLFDTQFTEPTLLTIGGDFDMAVRDGKVHMAVQDVTSQPTSLYTSIGRAGAVTRQNLWGGARWIGSLVEPLQVAMGAPGQVHVGGVYYSTLPVNGRLTTFTYVTLYNIDEQTGEILSHRDLVTSQVYGVSLRYSLAAAGATMYVAWQESGLSVMASHDSGETFTPPVVLSTSYNIIGARSIAADQNGNVYVAWLDSSSSGDHHLYIAKSTDFGITFSSPTVIASGDPGSFLRSPQVAFTGDTVHVGLMKGNAGSYKDVAIYTSTDAGRTFKAPVNITGSMRGEYVGQFSLAADAQGKALAAWITHSSDLSASQLLLSRLN